MRIFIIMELFNVNDFELAAKLKLDQSTYEYIAGGAGDEYTLRRNSEAFEHLQLIPRILQSSDTIQTNIKLLNHQLSYPLFVAPSAFHRIVHDLGELATVSAVNKAGIGMVLSTMSTVALEDVAALATGPLWFQVYIYKDRQLTQQLIKRAEHAGFDALVLTVDVPIMGTREKDKRNRFRLQTELLVKNFEGMETASIATHKIDSDVKHYTDALFDPNLTWKDIEWIQSHTYLPVILKGVMHEEDAKIALDFNVAALIISNHGGRQLDYMPATIEVLPAIAEVINKKIPLLIDGGFKRGIDVFKAIALGADCIMLGRSVLWALAVSGADGVNRLLNIYCDELKEIMILCGCETIQDIKTHGKSIVRFKEYTWSSK